jgi:hypothetical protein
MSRTVSIFLAIVVIILVGVAASVTGLISVHVGGNADQAAYRNKGVLEVVCDAEISKPGERLTPPFEVTRTPMQAVFNFDEGTGAYPGEYTISMNRKGTLKVDKDLLEIYRPAMFKRHGMIIIGEHVTLDRRTGELKQWLDLDGGKRLDLIVGHCKRTNNAPF